MHQPCILCVLWRWCYTALHWRGKRGKEGPEMCTFAPARCQDKGGKLERGGSLRSWWKIGLRWVKGVFRICLQICIHISQVFILWCHKVALERYLTSPLKHALYHALLTQAANVMFPPSVRPIFQKLNFGKSSSNFTLLCSPPPPSHSLLEHQSVTFLYNPQPILSWQFLPKLCRM